MFNEEIKLLEQQGLKRSVYVYSGVINLSSNDYLGMSHEPSVIKKAEEALRKYGLGGTSSRLLAGTKNPHIILEERLASQFGKEAGLVFSSGYHVNTGIIPVVMGVGDLVLVDALCHASIIDGVRLSKARFVTFQHNDMAHLGTLLQKKRQLYNRVIIVTEGVFSMDGDIPPLREIVKLAKQWNALVYMDEAHSMGVFGPQGKGLAAKFDLMNDIDIIVGTLSKTLGSQGGFVVGSRSLKELLVSKSRSFIYTTSLAPACAAGALEALQLLPQVENKRQNILRAAEKIREKLKALGFDTFKSESQIVPVRTGGVSETKKLSDYLLTCGFLVPSIRPPTVPVGEGRVRLSMTSELASSDLDRLIEAFARYKHNFTQEKAILV